MRLPKPWASSSPSEAEPSNATPNASEAGTLATTPYPITAEQAQPAPRRNNIRPPMHEQQPSIRIERRPVYGEDQDPEPRLPWWKSPFSRGKQSKPSADAEGQQHPPLPTTSEPIPTEHGGPSANPTLHQQPNGAGNPRAPEESAVRDMQYDVAPEDKRFTDKFWNAGERAEDAIKGVFGLRKKKQVEQAPVYNSQEYDSNMVDFLDVVDPEISTLSTLTNVQNSLFVPSLGKMVNRRPVYKLTEHPRNQRIIEKLRAPIRKLEEKLKRPGLPHKDTLTSQMSDSHYAVLPHGERLEGWTHEEKLMLDDLVRHMLHSRKAKLKRRLKGFGQYVRRPLGLFITVYATLITIFGAAWVLFLIGWISLGEKKEYVINIVDNILVALFAIIGDGLAPFRAVDTYHMIYIAHYHRQSWRRRKKHGLPDLIDHNDLPEHRKEEVQSEADIERLAIRRTSTMRSSWEFSVLTPGEQAKLEYHERKFSKSHTFYKSHETETHYAFPLRLLIVIVVLLDMHSALQISLGACTWGINYKTRPFALTTVILCCSITCNIMGGVLISVGDHRTRKKDVIERMMRQELTAEAKEELEKKWMKEAEERGDIDPAERKRIEEEMEAEENEEIKRQWKDVPLLPKKLLGKGADHREPALPQHSRTNRSRRSLDSSREGQPESHKSAGLRSKFGSSSQPSTPIRPVHEEPPEEGKRDKLMRMIRRADMDMS